jgi:hypothetical protein
MTAEESTLTNALLGISPEPKMDGATFWKACACTRLRRLAQFLHHGTAAALMTARAELQAPKQD